MMQNGLNESFWDAHGVETGACANFSPKTLFWRTGKNYEDWMLGVQVGGPIHLEGSVEAMAAAMI